MQIILIRLECILEFAKAKQSVINEYTMLPLADRFVDQDRRDGRIYPARKSADDSIVRADRFADLFDLFANKTRRRPVAFASANIK